MRDGHSTYVNAIDLVNKFYGVSVKGDLIEINTIGFTGQCNEYHKIKGDENSAEWIMITDIDGNRISAIDRHILKDSEPSSFILPSVLMENHSQNATTNATVVHADTPSGYALRRP